MELSMPKPLFQQRCAIIALKYGAWAIGHLTLGDKESAEACSKAAKAYAEMAAVKIKSQMLQSALNAYPLPFD